MDFVNSRPKISSLAVFCGARENVAPGFKELSRHLGQVLAENGVTLVYGGGRVGLMGEVAQGVLRNNGRVIGVIPESLMEKELGLKECHELHVVKTMHERKALMAEKAQAFMAIPGGFGTLDEIFEIITWRQLGFHQKPVIFLNHENYYGKLLDFCHDMQNQGFVSSVDLSTIEIYQTLDEWVGKWKKSKQL